MLAEHAQRFRRIVDDYLERPAGDYAELLHRGLVTSREGVDPEEWREQIRRQARQDKIRVITRTGSDGTSACAMLSRTLANERAGEIMQAELGRGDELRGLEEACRKLGHKPLGWLRSGDEYASACATCHAPMYVSFGAQSMQDGEGLTDPCPRYPSFKGAA